MTDSPRFSGSSWSKLETARSVILLALVADGLQIATALTTALLDPTKWREFVIISSLAAALVVALAVIATWPAVSAARRALGIVFVLANVAFVVIYAQAGTTLAAGSNEPSTQPQASPTAPTTTSPSEPPASDASPSSASVAPVTHIAGKNQAPVKSNAPVAQPSAWTVSVDTSHELEVPPNSGLQLRFWSYPSANEVVGDLRYEGGYAWAPVGFGSGCSAPYVTYIFSGIPAGRYVVSVHVPDIDGLTSSATYSGSSLELALDQSAHRGEWVDLPSVSTNEVEGNDMIGITQKQRYDQYSGDTGCVTRGERIAFDAIRVTKLR